MVLQRNVFTTWARPKITSWLCYLFWCDSPSHSNDQVRLVFIHSKSISCLWSTTQSVHRVIPAKTRSEFSNQCTTGLSMKSIFVLSQVSRDGPHDNSLSHTSISQLVKERNVTIRPVETHDMLLTNQWTDLTFSETKAHKTMQSQFSSHWPSLEHLIRKNLGLARDVKIFKDFIPQFEFESITNQNKKSKKELASWIVRVYLKDALQTSQLIHCSN